MSLTVQFHYNRGKKEELQRLIDNGVISFDYDIQTNMFTKSVEDHGKVIDRWVKTYGKDSELSDMIEDMRTSKQQRYSDKRVGVSCDNSRTFKIFVLVFGKPEDDDRIYGELSAKIYLNAEDDNIVDLIHNHTETLAGLIIGHGDNSYTIED